MIGVKTESFFFSFLYQLYLIITTTQMQLFLNTNWMGVMRSNKEYKICLLKTIFLP